MTAVPAFVEERHLQRLAWFVIRARRVEQHSLLADQKRVEAWIRGTMRVQHVDGKPSTVTWDLPDEEALESLAARCRPFLLDRDSMFLANVIKAVEYFVQDPADPAAVALKHVRKSWQRLNKSNPDMLGFSSRAGKVGGPLGDLVTDKALAYAWLYGDLVHSDDIPSLVGEHDIDSRFQGGSLLILNAAICAVATLNIIRNLRGRGLITLPDEPFEQRVLASPDSHMAISDLVIGPAGTPIEVLENLFGKGDDEDPSA